MSTRTHVGYRTDQHKEFSLPVDVIPISCISVSVTWIKGIYKAQFLLVVDAPNIKGLDVTRISKEEYDIVTAELTNAPGREPFRGIIGPLEFI